MTRKSTHPIETQSEPEMVKAGSTAEAENHL